MRTILALIILVALTVTIKATDFGLDDSGTKNFKLNPEVNQPVLKFYSTTPVEDIEGTVMYDKDVISNVTLDPANIEELKGSISFNVKSLKTGIKMRDEHLCSPDWLNADKNPKISFEVLSVKNVKPSPKGELKGKADVSTKVVGNFSVNGKSKQIEVPVTLSYIKATEQTAKRAPGDFIMVDGEFEIALKDFDVKGSKGIIGKKVGETIKITFKLFYNSGK